MKWLIVKIQGKSENRAVKEKQQVISDERISGERVLVKRPSKKTTSMENQQQKRINSKRSKHKITEPNKQGHIAAVEYLSLSSCMKIFIFPRLIPKTVWDIL